MVFISVQTLREELEDCSHALSELDVAVQEFGEQNPLLARQLGATLSKLAELHSQTSRLAEGRNTRIKKVNTVRRVTTTTLFCCISATRFLINPLLLLVPGRAAL